MAKRRQTRELLPGGFHGNNRSVQADAFLTHTILKRDGQNKLVLRNQHPLQSPEEARHANCYLAAFMVTMDPHRQTSS